MQFFIFILLICFFIFLYCVYVLANDDFIFLRRDVTMERLFNIIFLGAFSSLLFSRLFYGFAHAKAMFSNLLVFLLIPYFPGLSLLGGVVGAGIYLFLLTKRSENLLPLRRIYDFLSISFLISLPVGFIGYLLFFEEKMILIKSGSQAISYLVLSVIFLKFFLPRLLNGKFKEGTITLLFLIGFSIVNLVSDIFPISNVLDYFKNFENTILIIILISSIGVITKYEHLFSKNKTS